MQNKLTRLQQKSLHLIKFLFNQWCEKYFETDRKTDLENIFQQIIEEKMLISKLQLISSQLDARTQHGVYF